MLRSDTFGRAGWTCRKVVVEVAETGCPTTRRFVAEVDEVREFQQPMIGQP